MIIMKTLWSALTSPVGLIIVCVVAVLAYSAVIYREGKNNGASDVVNHQNKVDSKIIEGARDSRDDVDRCRARGMLWSRDTGKCS